MTTVSLDRPFAYSTSTWHDRGCHKNITKFLPVDQFSPSPGSFDVDVDLRTLSKDDKHEYLLRSPKNSPHIIFLLPGDEEISDLVVIETELIDVNVKCV